MDYLLITTNDTLVAEIDTILGAPKRAVQASLQNSLVYLEDKFPEAIILDIDAYGSPSLRFISSLRLMHPMANIPIVALTNDAQNKLQEQLYLFSNITEIEPRRIEQDLLMYMEISIDQHLNERTDALAHPYTLEQIADIWREGLSGKLLLHNQRQITLSMGGIKKRADLTLLEEMLFQPPAYFRKTTAESSGDWITVGDILWNHVQKWCHPGFLRYRKWLRFIPTTQAHRAMDLDLNLYTRRLLFATDDQKSLLERLREKSLRIQQVEKDLESLYFLGLYTFAPVVAKKIEALGSTVLSEQLILVDEDLQIFLEESIDESWDARNQPNPWCSFCLDPKTSLNEQLQNKIENHTSFLQVNSPSAKRKAIQVITHLKNLENKLGPIVNLYKIYGFPDDPNGQDETNFWVGYHSLQKKSYRKAYEAFSQIIDKTPRYQAYLGWSLFLHDSSQAEKALRLMQPALTPTQTSIVIHCYATTIMGHLNQWEHAEHRLRILLQEHNFEQIRSMLWYCKSRSIPDHCWVYRN
jgi:hypothetical protein